MKVINATIRLPLTKIKPENPLPMLRDLSEVKELIDGGLLPDEKHGFADDTGFRVLPYRMQDEYETAPVSNDLPAVILENEHLKATFLPSLGGRLYSLFDKNENRECLFTNPVIKMGNLALRNAWFAGGIEWNFGHFGHTFFSCAPVHFARVRDENDEEFARMYVFERCHSTLFQVDFHLPSGAKALTVHMVCTNPNPEDAPFFLWTNTAVTERNNPRIFSGTNEVIIQHQGSKPEDNHFLHATLPDPYKEGIDHSYPALISHAEEYFFQNERRTKSAYEVAAYDDGTLFIDRSSGNFPYRKMFCWGNHKGGKRWQEQLSIDGNAYLEVQAGYARSQVHGTKLKPHESLHFTQLFAPGKIAPDQVSGNYVEAGERIRKAVDEVVSVDLVEAEHARSLLNFDKPAEEVLHHGLGWEALESLRDPNYFPSHLTFPESELTNEQKPWLALINGQNFTGADSFQTGIRWLELLENAAKRDPDNPHLMLHLGLARCEHLDKTGAILAWTHALRQAPSPLVNRCLAFLMCQQGDMDNALHQMQHAIELLGAPNRAYAEEYLLMLVDAGRYEEAYSYYSSLPEDLRKGERMSLTATLAAFKMGDDDYLDEQFARTYSVYKEGERSFIDTWFKRETLREAERRGVPYSEALEREIRITRELPENIDYRMTREE